MFFKWDTSLIYTYSTLPNSQQKFSYQGDPGPVLFLCNFQRHKLIMLLMFFLNSMSSGQQTMKPKKHPEGCQWLQESRAGGQRQCSVCRKNIDELVSKEQKHVNACLQQSLHFLLLGMLSQRAPHRSFFQKMSL